MPLLIELHYLPCIQYFCKLLKYTEIYLEQKEHYSKGSYRNRCYIAGSNGPLMLSVPLAKGKNQQQDIRDTRISYHENWQNQHWRAIRSAYGNSPYFDYYSDTLHAFYQKKYEHLFDFNYDLLLWLVDRLQLDISINLSREFQKEANTFSDWRNGIHPKTQRQRKDDHFKAAYYPQAFEDRHGFLSNLSILDLLFCSGPQASLILENSLRTE